MDRLGVGCRHNVGRFESEVGQCGSVTMKLLTHRRACLPRLATCLEDASGQESLRRAIVRHDFEAMRQRTIDGNRGDLADESQACKGSRASLGSLVMTEQLPA